MKKTITLTIIALSCLIFAQCTLLSNNKTTKTSAKTKNVLYQYITQDNAKKYRLNTDRNSEYFIFNKDNSFIYENHRDTYFSFGYGIFIEDQNNEISLIVDTIISQKLIKTYRDSTIWNYRFTTEDFSNKIFKISGDSLIINSKSVNSYEKVLLINK